MTDDSRIQIYRTKDGETCVDVRFEKETVWLTQRQIKRKLKHYNLDAVISVGFRVNSKRGEQFRIAA